MYPCVVFALHREAAPFLRRFTHRSPLRDAPCPAWMCGESLRRVIVLEAGVGADRCREALHWLHSSWLPGAGLIQPMSIVSAGFSGALVPEWRIGDVLTASEIVDSQGRRWACDPVPPPTPGRRMYCSDVLVGHPDRKRLLGREHQAAAVDMESAAVAEFCAEEGVPFHCVRVISDEVQTALSTRLLRLLEGNAVSWRSVMVEVLRAPSLLRELHALGRATSLAARRLASSLRRIVLPITA